MVGGHWLLVREMCVRIWDYAYLASQEVDDVESLTVAWVLLANMSLIDGTWPVAQHLPWHVTCVGYTGLPFAHATHPGPQLPVYSVVQDLIMVARGASEPVFVSGKGSPGPKAPAMGPCGSCGPCGPTPCKWGNPPT